MTEHLPPDDLREALDRLRRDIHQDDRPAALTALEDVIRIVLHNVSVNSAAVVTGPYTRIEREIEDLKRRLEAGGL